MRLERNSGGGGKGEGQEKAVEEGKRERRRGKEEGEDKRRKRRGGGGHVLNRVIFKACMNSNPVLIQIIQISKAVSLPLRARTELHFHLSIQLSQILRELRTSKY